MSFLFAEAKAPAKTLAYKLVKNPSESRQMTSVVKQLPASVVMRHTFRFQASSGVTLIPCTVGDVFGIIGNIGTVTNSSVVGIASSIRVNAVKVYSSGQGGAVVNGEIAWSSSADVNTEDLTLTNATIPYDRPSVVRSEPPVGSLASFWWNSSSTSTTNLFGVSAAIGSIIDVDVSWTLVNTLPSYTTSVATAVVGTFYYLALDGPASNKLTPVGVPTTH